MFLSICFVKPKLLDSYLDMELYKVSWLQSDEITNSTIRRDQSYIIYSTFSHASNITSSLIVCVCVCLDVVGRGELYTYLIPTTQIVV